MAIWISPNSMAPPVRAGAPQRPLLIGKGISHFAIDAFWLVVLALGVMWGIWLSLDLPRADTSFYFRAGNEWNRNGAFPSGGQMSFSPLYCVYYSLFQRTFPDAGDATFL